MKYNLFLLGILLCLQKSYAQSVIYSDTTWVSKNEFSSVLHSAEVRYAMLSEQDFNKILKASNDSINRVLQKYHVMIVPFYPCHEPLGCSPIDNYRIRIGSEYYLFDFPVIEYRLEKESLKQGIELINLTKRVGLKNQEPIFYYGPEINLCFYRSKYLIFECKSENNNMSISDDKSIQDAINYADYMTLEIRSKSNKAGVSIEFELISN